MSCPGVLILDGDERFLGFFEIALPLGVPYLIPLVVELLTYIAIKRKYLLVVSGAISKTFIGRC